MSDTGKYVTLVSCDGFEFVVLRELACLSPILRKMLDPRAGWKEATENRCYLGDINGMLLEEIVKYLYFAQVNKGREGVPDMDIAPELCLELLDVADYLDL